MKTIYKFPVEPNSRRDGQYLIEILAPMYAKPLCVMMQGVQTCIWMEVESATPKADWETIRFACVGTGHGAVPPNGAYFGSVIDGEFVWHFYRVP